MELFCAGGIIESFGYSAFFYLLSSKDGLLDADLESEYTLSSTVEEVKREGC